MIRIGVDFGGTKIEAAALGDDGAYLARKRVANPGGYDAAVAGRARLVTRSRARPAARARSASARRGRSRRRPA